MSLKKITYDKYDILGHDQVNAIQDAILANEQAIVTTNKNLTEHKHAINDISELSTILNSCGKIQTGSYLGSGGYGVNAPNTLTFKGNPKFVIIQGQYIGDEIGYENHTVYQTAVWISGSNNITHVAVSVNNDLAADLDGATLTWYNAYSAGFQLNKSGVTYYYLAIYE